MCQASVVVICHPGLSGFDAKDLNRIYTGRVVRVGGEAVRPVNLKSGSSVRDVFMRDVLKQSDDDYISYWIVRRAIGKGAPPPEIDNPNELLDFIRHNAGAIGYLDNTGLDLTGVTVVLTVGK
ncbi:MAG: hypothetical protein LBU39_09840 [Desulfobulbaceae bacterium]|nr:hypothetical protein [Desulfobulbaceae bacterium]